MGMWRRMWAVAMLMTVVLVPGDAAAVEPAQGKIVREVSTSQKVVALTFDDGPYPNTPTVLDVLKKHGAKATFFPIGKRVTWLPDTARRMAEEGHEIANHTFSHPSAPVMKRISKEELHSEMLDASQVIEEITQYKPVLFRPPGGYFNHTIVSTANEDHYTVVLWSPNLDTKDWRHPGVGKIVKCVLDNVHNGSIILFHDREKQTTQALEVILPELEKQGYQFVTVSELLRG